MQEVQDLINIIIEEYAGGNYIFRGTPKVHSKKKDGINSSLYRWAKDNDVLFSEHFSPVDIEKEIVEKAKKYFPPNTSNIEILTDLRHYGGSVTLIDFSRNLYVALFFACNGNFENDGELIVLKTDEFNTVNDIEYSKKEPQIKVIEPANTQTSQRRTISQDSIFVVAPKGYINKNSCGIFKIEAKLKQKIIEYLRNFHNIYTDTIYNDLIGFIDNEENYTTAEVEFYKGLSKQKEGSNKEAIDHYNKAIEINPRNYVAYYNRGIAKSILGQHEKAIEDYNKSIGLNSQFAESYFCRGTIKSALGQKQEAIEDYSKAVEINPQFSEAYFSRGNIKSYLGQKKEAIEDYSKAIEINPQYAEAYSNRGVTKYALGQREETIEDYNKAIEINPQLAEAYNNRGNTKSYLGQKKEAIEDYNKSIELNPKHASAYSGRGIAKFALGKNKEAMEDLKKAIELDTELSG